MAAWRKTGEVRAVALRKAIAALPTEYEVEEEPWSADLPHGAVLWWGMIGARALLLSLR